MFVITYLLLVYTLASKLRVADRMDLWAKKLISNMCWFTKLIGDKVGI